VEVCGVNFEQMIKPSHPGRIQPKNWSTKW
jgi:hypothetical protein